jgi:hypothetical protein
VEEKIIREPWSEQAEQGLCQALDGYGEFFKSQVNTGIAELYRIGSESWFIVRQEIDQTKGTQILVVCCYQGEKLADFVEYLIDTCRKNKFDEIRFHTKRPGLAKWMKNQFNFQVAEYVSVLKVH